MRKPAHNAKRLQMLANKRGEAYKLTCIKLNRSKKEKQQFDAILDLRSDSFSNVISHSVAYYDKDDGRVYSAPLLSPLLAEAFGAQPYTDVDVADGWFVRRWETEEQVERVRQWVRLYSAVYEGEIDLNDSYFSKEPETRAKLEALQAEMLSKLHKCRFTLTDLLPYAEEPTDYPAPYLTRAGGRIAYLCGVFGDEELAERLISPIVTTEI